MGVMNKLDHRAFAPLAAALMGLTLSACATATTGGDTLMLVDPQLAARSHISTVKMSSDWVRATEDFSDTFTEALWENLQDCARGPEKLNLHVHVSKVHRADRVGALIRGGGRHELAAVAELVHPKTRQVVGRYPIHVIVDAGNPAEIVLADRQLMVSDAFATQLCREAFGA
jgi:hypothetical protein